MDELQILELGNENIEIHLGGCVVTWSEINGDPKNNKALIALLTELLKEKVDKNEEIEAGTHTKITYDEKGLVIAGEDLSIEDLPELHLKDIVDVVASVDEVNKLHGLLSTTEELNKLHGLLATTNELNILHNLQTSTEELNKLKGLLVTYAELNMLKGIKSNIQEQLDKKQDTLTYKAEDSANKVNIIEDSTITYPSSKALKTGLDSKQDKLTDKQMEILNSDIKAVDIEDLKEGKLDKNPEIIGDTKAKITYDEKGLVTKGEDLTTDDIPTLPLSKIGDVNVTHYEINRLEGLLVEATDINKLQGVTSNLQPQIDNITKLISEDATEDNKLADKKFVKDWVYYNAGYFLTKDDKNTPFNSYAELLSTVTFYNNGVIKAVTDNDFVVVTSDETRNNAVIMYAWIKDDIYNEGHWKFQYKISNSYDDLVLDWGLIRGDIKNQKDLMTEFAKKQDKFEVGDGLELTEDGVLNNTRTSAEYGNIVGNIEDQKDLVDYIARTALGLVVENGMICAIVEEADVNYTDDNTLEINNKNYTEIDGNIIIDGLSVVKNDDGNLTIE